MIGKLLLLPRVAMMRVWKASSEDVSQNLVCVVLRGSQAVQWM